MAIDHEKSIEETFIKRALAGFDELSAGIYRELGPATGANQFTNKQQVALATYTIYPDPLERAQRAQAMLKDGMTIEQVTDEIYPRLRPLIELAGTGVLDRIAYAKHIRNLVDKQTPTFQELINQNPETDSMDGTVLDELPKMEDGSVDPLFNTTKPIETLHPMIPVDDSSTGDFPGMTPPPSGPPPLPVNSLYPQTQGPIPATPPMNLIGG